jgi:hypothetical protein
MTESQSPTGFKKFLLKLSSETVLVTLVALLSVLTATAAWQGSLYDSKESDANVEGQKQLTEANSMYIESNQFVIYDYSMYDGWYISYGKDDEVAQYYYDSFSESLQASMDREEGPFDDQYYTEMYADAEAFYDEALTYFDEAQAAGDTADQMQLVVLIFAVGLALAAYGSIMPAEKGARAIFAIGSIAGLVLGLFFFITAF